MSKGMLANKIFDSRVPEEKITGREKILGFFVGPIAVMVMNCILSNYLNVYYTDILKISGIWGGMFISLFPIVAKLLDILTFIYMGLVVDRTRSRQGKARPWILFSAPLLVICMVLLFVVPKGNDNLTAVWIFISYTIFYAIAYTMYSTAHTLIVPLATRNDAERQQLSTIANTPAMAAGSFVAILFPCVLVPFMGVSKSRWVMVALILAGVSFPMILFEFFFTRERVKTNAVSNKKNGTNVVSNKKGNASTPSKETGKTGTVYEQAERISLTEQLRCCMKSRNWVVLMIYLILINLVNALFGAGTFYYCNWVLGSYNDGHTQALFYALGQAPLGVGILLCAPVCKKFGKRNAILGGMVVATIGVILCLVNPRSLVIVLAGQVIRTIGLIPSTYMVSSMLGDALDDVEQESGKRCDGFSSSVFNCITTITGGVALCLFNYGISHLGYQAPAAEIIPVQNDTIQGFLVFCVIGIQLIAYPIIGVLTRFFKEKRTP